jgi:hypothetical protein
MPQLCLKCGTTIQSINLGTKGEAPKHRRDCLPTKLVPYPKMPLAENDIRYLPFLIPWNDGTSMSWFGGKGLV